jgi:hypothetical protein
MFAALIQIVIAQDGEAGRMFLSNSLKPDPVQMDSATGFNPGDPIYFVLTLNPKGKEKIGDAISTDPTTKEKNIYICIDVFSSTAKHTCTGILKTPFSPDVLNGRSIVYPIIPAVNDINVDNGDVVNAVLRGLQGADGQIQMTITLKNYSTQAETVAVMKYDVDVTKWNGSRWSQYRGLFLAREHSADRERELAAWDNKPLPQAKFNDPVLEKEIWRQIPILFGTNYKIYKAVISQPNWEYSKNDYGILTARSIYLAIMAKNLETGDCVIEWGIFAREEYLHGSTYAPVNLYWPKKGNRSLVRCEKFVGFK